MAVPSGATGLTWQTVLVMASVRAMGQAASVATALEREASIKAVLAATSSRAKEEVAPAVVMGSS